MGRDNHNAGMHFIRHSSRVSDADAVAYISRKEAEIRQADTREKYADLLEYDNPCCFHIKDMTDRVHVNYYDESNPNDCSMYTYPIKNARNKKKSELTLWVGYDIGGKNYITGEIEPRGYYFYFTNFFEKNITSRKLLLFEVNRKSKADMERAISYASAFGKAIVSNYYNRYEIGWDKPIYEEFGCKSCWMSAERIRLFRSIKNCELIMC